MIQAVVEESGGDGSTAKESAALAVSKMFEVTEGVQPQAVDLGDVTTLASAIDTAATEASQTSGATITVSEERKNVLKNNIKTLTDRIDTVLSSATTSTTGGLTSVLTDLTKLDKVAKTVAQETTIKDVTEINTAAAAKTIAAVRVYAPPSLTLNPFTGGGISISYTQGAVTEFTEPGYTATHQVDGDISNNVVVTGSVDVNVVGDYTLTYTVTDSFGLTSTATRIVKIVAPAATSEPEPESETGTYPSSLKLWLSINNNVTKDADNNVTKWVDVVNGIVFLWCEHTIKNH